MTHPDPAWLTRALGGTPATGHLSIARLADAESLGRGGFALSSPAFPDGGELDPSFTAHEEDAVAPPLEWTAPPAGAAELVLIVEDADAGAGEAPCHWLVWGLPAQRAKLLEGEAPPRTGKNASGNSEWLLPRLGADDGTRRYVFQLFASDVALTARPGAAREDIVKALDGHVVAAAILTGSFAQPEEDEQWDDGDI
ncbi:YbhB/YbcL family Raf kinase inhibitor-like protein [Porphyrobacter sp. GA68]|uniref:YbhB/YbcL family Raf kinase inhibitor-like protein n=1 Tax=Porphyrobacter sp. GA68 TaxID=2883480 RepID=UPI001D1957E6|nr:YbhB/YbcL family Raf kinase inhibitor-like protein [Porphyrobacter sp. GA68]